MTILVSSSNSPKPQSITERSKGLPRIVPASMSTSCKFRASLGQGTIKIKLPKTSEKNNRRKNETNTYKKKIKEEKGKREFIGHKLVFPVKKMTSVITGVFSRKKTLAGEKRGKRGDSAEKTTEADETLDVGKSKPKQNSLQKKESLWESARGRLKILILGQRLKTRRKRRRRRSLSEAIGEDELCKKRILMGGRCKPLDQSGVLQYDGDGILLPEP